MAKHHPDLIMCRKQPGIAIGRVCEKDDGKCVVCDSFVRACTLVRVCDECNYEVDASFVEVLASPTLITARSALYLRKTEMDVPRLSILEVPRPICSMNERNMVSKNDNRQFSDLNFRFPA